MDPASAHHRTVEQQQALTMIRARDVLVRLRTSVVNAARGLAKPCGHRLPAASTRSFPARCAGPASGRTGGSAGTAVRADRAHECTDQTVRSRDPEVGDGDLSGNPGADAGPPRWLSHGSHVCPNSGSKERFERSRDVGCYLGLRPKRSQSGDRDPQLRVTKAGNEYATPRASALVGLPYVRTVATRTSPTRAISQRCLAFRSSKFLASSQPCAAVRQKHT